MARPRYTAAKRARELKQKAKREAKLARKHARTSGAAPTGATPPAAPGDATPAADSPGPVTRPDQEWRP